MNRNISIIESTGKPASNQYGSCAVLAISNIIGMSYEQATAWTVKNRLAARVINTDGIDHVAGTRYHINPDGLQTYKKLRPNAKVINYMNKHVYTYYVEKAGQDGRPSLEEVKEMQQCDGFERQCKISTFAKNNPRGRFLIITRDHALALINGVIYNNNNEGGRYTNQIIKYTVKF